MKLKWIISETLEWLFSIICILLFIGAASLNAWIAGAFFAFASIILNPLFRHKYDPYKEKKQWPLNIVCAIAFVIGTFFLPPLW